MKPSKTQERIWISAGVIFILLLWQLLSMLAKSEQLLPSPLRTSASLIKLYSDIGFMESIAITVFRGLLGMIIALLLACCLALLSAKSEAFRLFLTPSIITLRSTPVISFILLAIVWLAPNQVPIFIAILTMVPVIYSNVLEGILQIDPKLKRMSTIFKIGRRQKLLQLFWPSVQPYFYSGLSTALGFGWRAIIVGEVLAHPEFGIGAALKNAQTYLQVDKIIAWTIVGILISAVFDKVISSLRNRSLKWQSA